MSVDADVNVAADHAAAEQLDTFQAQAPGELSDERVSTSRADESRIRAITRAGDRGPGLATVAASVIPELRRVCRLPMTAICPFRSRTPHS